MTHDDDVFRDECGVFGAWGCKEAAQICYLGLYSLQHRGQESAGIVTADASNFYVVKDMGLVSEIFNPDNLSHLKGQSGVGHVRYSTTGASMLNNVQPLYTKTSKGKIAVAHNGNNCHNIIIIIRCSCSYLRRFFNFGLFHI